MADFFDQAKQTFSEVKKSLDVNKSLQWATSIEALKCTLQFVDTPEAKQFIDEYLFKVINLMTQQSPSKLGTYEKQVMEESIHVTLRIVLKALPHHPSLLPVLSRIFDNTIPYYNGSKAGYTFTPGNPSLRISIAKKFQEANGFHLLNSVLKRPDFTWPGCEHVLNILKILSLNDVLNGVDDHTKEETMSAFMQRIVSLPDEQLKRENLEALVNVNSILSVLSSHLTQRGLSHCMDRFHVFWFDIILKFMNSSSLVLKLRAWEQLEDIIQEAKATRPLASSYTIEAAGSEAVNGAYTAANTSPPYDHHLTDVLKYVKQADKAQNIPLLTLFRCTMRTKAKWWFLSQADIEKPGTDKDIDYYLHKSSLDEEREPPSRGWTRSNPGINLIGIDPAPILKRGELILPAGKSKESYLDVKLLQWFKKKTLVSLTFGSSIHREIVARSGKLLLFLAEYNELTSEDLQLVWKAATTSQEGDIVEEVFNLIIPISPYLGDALFSELIDLALSTLKEQPPEQYIKITLFTEKFAMENFKFVEGLLTEIAAAKLLSLVWEVYRTPQFDSLRNPSTLQELLTFCFRQKGGLNMVVQRITECTAALRALSSPHAAIDEAPIHRIINTLNFLISQHTTVEITNHMNNEGFPLHIVDEIKRFISSSRELQLVQPAAISARLRILRKFYGLNPSLFIPRETVETLSQLLSDHPSYREEFFLFLKSGCLNLSSSEDVMIAVDDTVAIFQTIVCSTQIDWAQCKEGAFDCFSTFFGLLEVGAQIVQSHNTDNSASIALDALWRIALLIDVPTAVHSAINLLLQTYEGMLHRDPEAYSGMLKIVFGHLQEAVDQCVSATTQGGGGGGGGVSRDWEARVSRCVTILSAALIKSKGHVDLAHVIRGCMSRFQVVVHYRRIHTYYNPSTHADITRIEKGSEGKLTLAVHPLHTVLQLKERIKDLAQLGGVTIHLDNVDLEVISDHSRVMELGLVDGSDIAVNYQMTFAHKAYEEDLYSATGSLRPYTDRAVHVGQVLSTDYRMFDCLLTLCELCKDLPPLLRDLWQLLMLIPTQADLLQQSLERMCMYEDSSSNSSGSTSSSSSSDSTWTQVLQGSSSAARTTYLLQIIDNLLQPAPEMMLTPELLQQQQQQQSMKSNKQLFRNAFIRSGGLPLVLRILIATPVDSNSIIDSTALAVALHIVHFLLSSSTVAPISNSNIISSSSSSSSSDTDSAITDALLQQVEQYSVQVAGKLLQVASRTGAFQDPGVVQDALVVISQLIASPEVVQQLTTNPQSEVLLSTILRSDTKKVRVMAADFAIQVGSSQPIVFRWLLDQLVAMKHNDENCSEVFYAISQLLARSYSASPSSSSSDKSLRNATAATASSSTLVNEHATQLAAILSEKLRSYPREKQPQQEERYALHGYLETLNSLIQLDPQAVLRAQLGEHLFLESFLADFLFAMPRGGGGGGGDLDRTPICDTSATRQAAFSVLSSYLSISMDGFEAVLNELNKLSRTAARYMKPFWGLQVSHDIKKPDVQFTGLKNQGCTCYMNSLLQFLFMNTAFREGILATPLLEIHRTSLWHKSDIDLVGKYFLFELCNGAWKKGQIIGYDATSCRHRVQYANSDSSLEEVAIFNIHEGRYQRETGRVKVIPPSPVEGSSIAVEAMDERQEAAYRVLDQLQRTFCFMKLSKRRFFDPVLFVEACRSLNLNFNVYHQNDAAEFADQLLDRIETATKGKHTQQDVWNNTFMSHVFGGKWLYQKIPKDCEAYDRVKETCGHWQSSRQESFLKVELIIRGKDKIEDSLGDLIQGELMDGDNKIQCDVCTQKKATTRRTCFGHLPNTMILHLKRFDLDFQTFETVKLNNRMAFPLRINMFEYTKEGIEQLERTKLAEAGGGTEGGGVDEHGHSRSLDYEGIADELSHSSFDRSDYEYELQGVLVHAGVAQGGHYYSFVRSDDTDETATAAAAAHQWYKFDDDEVTHFNADNIPLQCFGGPPSAHSPPHQGNSSHSLMEEDRTSNALMLLYNKVKQPPQASLPASSVSSASSASSSSKLELVDGMQAYRREVQESNLQHALSCYLLDSDLHAFVRGLLESLTERTNQLLLLSSTSSSNNQLSGAVGGGHFWSPLDTPDDLPLRTIQFSCHFLLDVVLHCRERAAMRSSINCLKAAFETFPRGAVWFISLIVDNNNCSWFADYILSCSDALARTTFAQILVQAATVVAPKDKDALSVYRTYRVADLRSVAQTLEPASLMALMVKLIIDNLFKSVNYIRTADEIFVLIRDLCAIPCMSKLMQSLGLVGFLCYFATPDLVPQVIKTMFEKNFPQQQARANTNVRAEYNNLLQNVYESIAALLGVPQLRKVNLLQERSYWDTDLVPEAKSALTNIFHLFAYNGGMDANDIVKYFDKVTNHALPKVSPLQIRNILDRFSTTADGKLNLDGFIQYHLDQATYNPKNVWRDLHAFGYKNDLSYSESTARPPRGIAEQHASNALSGGSGSGSDSSTVVEISITDNCRASLSVLAFYETGMHMSDAAARAILQRICFGDIEISTVLINQALNKLSSFSGENSWNQQPVLVIIEFLKLVLGITSDGLQLGRLTEMLLRPNTGIAVVVSDESNRASNRSHEFNRHVLFERYLNFGQELTTVPGMLDNLSKLAEEDSRVKLMKGMLRTKPGSQLTENEDSMIRSSVMVVDGAGVPEVNGTYRFKDIRCNSGYYFRMGQYEGKEANFTLYKCSLKSGGFQWFLSITPEGASPGTTNDIDFYFAASTPQDRIPSQFWSRMQPSSVSKDPPPRVQCVRDDASPIAVAVPVMPTRQRLESSDSDVDSNFLVVEDGDGYDVDAIDDSFVSTSSADGREYYE